MTSEETKRSKNYKGKKNRPHPKLQHIKFLKVKDAAAKKIPRFGNQ